jgi:hypothetical protein
MRRVARFLINGAIPVRKVIFKFQIAYHYWGDYEKGFKGAEKFALSHCDY